MLAEAGDSCASQVAEFVGVEPARRPSLGMAQHGFDYRRDGVFPSFGEGAGGLCCVPVSLFDDVGGGRLAEDEAIVLHLFMLRSRRARFVTGKCLVTDARTAELCKLSENSFRDVNIAFANELAEICEDFDIDVWELILLANHHPRVNILKPGPGVGGHCIAVDPWFIVSALGEKARLIREARWINSGRPRQVASESSKQGPQEAIFG